MDGYKRLPASWHRAVPLEDTRACSLCPKDTNELCKSTNECDAGHGMVWVPDHIHAVWLINASEQDKRSLATWKARNELD